MKTDRAWFVTHIGTALTKPICQLQQLPSGSLSSACFLPSPAPPPHSSAFSSSSVSSSSSCTHPASRRIPSSTVCVGRFVRLGDVANETLARLLLLLLVVVVVMVDANVHVACADKFNSCVERLPKQQHCSSSRSSCSTGIHFVYFLISDRHHVVLA